VITLRSLVAGSWCPMVLVFLLHTGTYLFLGQTGFGNLPRFSSACQPTGDQGEISCLETQLAKAKGPFPERLPRLERLLSLLLRQIGTEPLLGFEPQLQPFHESLERASVWLHVDPRAAERALLLLKTMAEGLLRRSPSHGLAFLRRLSLPSQRRLFEGESSALPCLIRALFETGAPSRAHLLDLLAFGATPEAKLEALLTALGQLDARPSKLPVDLLHNLLTEVEHPEQLSSPLYWTLLDLSQESRVELLGLFAERADGHLAGREAGLLQKALADQAMHHANDGKALGHLLKAQALFGAVPEDRLQLHYVHHDLAHLYLRRGESGKAQAHFRACLEHQAEGEGAAACRRHLRELFAPP